MLTAEGCRVRRDRLWRAAPDECDVIVIASPEHVAYLTGYWPSAFTFRTNEAGAMLVLTRERATLVGDNLLQVFLDDAHVDDVIAPIWYRGQNTAPPRRQMLAESVRDVLASTSAGVVGIEAAAVPAAMVQDRRVCDIGLLLVALRRTKEPDEVEVLRAAIRAAEAGMEQGARAAIEGATELDVYAAVASACHEALGTPALVYGDFAAGRRAMGPDTLPTGRELCKGDLLILDFSVIVRGYRGDFANTVCIGEPSPRQREVFDACVAALEYAESMLIPGTRCLDLDSAVRASLRERGFAADRPGHVGHGIGLAHPEAPFFVAESDEVLQVGDVVTLEPSLFPDDLDGGVRVEHNYWIGETNPRRLSSHSLSLSSGR